MTKLTDWEKWQRCAARYADKELCVGDLWDEEDPYEAHEPGADAFRLGQTPESFIRAHFDEDFARREGELEEYRESIEAGLEFDQE